MTSRETARTFPCMMRNGWLLFFLFGIAGISPGVEVTPETVVVVANENFPGSVALARHYLEVRNIPSENLITLAAPRDERISWQVFVDEVFNPLREKLVEEGWLNALRSNRQDRVGRDRYTVFSHKIGALVLMRGIPVRIENNRELANPELTARIPRQFHKTVASVDSELALLTGEATEITGALTNPLFERKNPLPSEQQQVLRVTRLDGASDEDVRGLIDSALQAEKHGLRGRAYLDVTGPHETGRVWLQEAGELAEEMGYDIDWLEGGNYEEWHRFDAAALYFAWYSSRANGPLLLPGLRFAPGAIAVHIHSFSASRLRRSNSGWVTPLVRRGVAATVGNVSEPYLQLTHRPQVLLEQLQEGKTFAEASMAALPNLSWQAVAVGDPLYRPFPPEDTASYPDDEYAIYHVLRRANLLMKKDPAAAMDLVQQHARDPVAAIWLSVRYNETEQKEAARKVLVNAEGEFTRPDQKMLRYDFARRLNFFGASDVAAEHYEVLLADNQLSQETRREILSRAAPTARLAGREALAGLWEASLAAIEADIAAQKEAERLRKEAEKREREARQAARESQEG